MREKVCNILNMYKEQCHSFRENGPNDIVENYMTGEYETGFEF